jgi:hypothetical protein
VSELRLGGLTWGVSRQTSSCTRVRQSNLLIHELFRPFSENFSPQLAASFSFHFAGLPSPPGWLILFQHFESGTGLTIKELAILNTAMGVAERSTCPHCGEYLMLALPPGGKGRRTLQCLECDRPDPLKSDALKWLSSPERQPPK